MKRILIPVAILAVGFALAAMIVATGPTLVSQPPQDNAPRVRVWQASAQSVRLTTTAHGTVLPRTESDLIPEVAGRVVDVAPALVSGGFFRRDDVLLKIDTLDYELSLEQAKAALASAASELENAERAHVRQLDLHKRQLTSDAQVDDALNRFQLAQARLRESQARLKRAQRDLQRTSVLAPYDGRVRSEQVDVGQFVNRGVPFARIYATDVAEVRLPIHDAELAFLDLPLDGTEQAPSAQPMVKLRATFAGRQHVWDGRIVRTEGELDPKTRMINVVARVDEPYRMEGDRPPLAVGLFVEAEIIGTEAEDVFVLPRSAVQADNQVYIVRADDTLEFRDIDIMRTVGESVYVTGGIDAGEVISLSTVNNAIDGMRIRRTEVSSVANAPANEGIGS